MEKIKIALAGNPNSGKTTMFNNLTGSRQYVGNWAGVTVEKKEGVLKGDDNVIIQDLPGIYSLSPYTSEEKVTREYLIDEKPDVILDLIDASNIERNLYLTLQLAEIGLPMVISLNMIDAALANGDIIYADKLEKALGCPVIPATALKGEGTFEAAEASKNAKNTPVCCKFSAHTEKALALINALLPAECANRRWTSIKLFERDVYVINKYGSEISAQAEKYIKECEKEAGEDSESIIAAGRYDYIEKIIAECVIKKKTLYKLSDKIDKYVTNRFLALPVFAAIMALVYFISVSTVGSYLSQWLLLAFDALRQNIEGHAGFAFFSGVFDGVSSVLLFVPQLFLLFLMLSLLEDCGYMARIAFIMDKIFRKFGLSGKSVIPMLLGTGCSVPGIMASRTIENESDRKAAIITTSFIPCSAKIPVIAIIAGYMGNSALVAVSAYFIGIAAVALSGLLLKKTHILGGKDTPFVMELPPYHIPDAKSIFLHTGERVASFIKKAGSVILLGCVIISILSNFDFSFTRISNTEDSMLAKIGIYISPLFKPLGWGNWRAVSAMLTGLAAKENIVSTLTILSENSIDASTVFNSASAYSFLIFNLLCAPCIAAIAAIKKEMNSVKLTLFTVIYQTVFAYITAFIAYNIF